MGQTAHSQSWRHLLKSLTSFVFLLCAGSRNNQQPWVTNQTSVKYRSSTSQNWRKPTQRKRTPYQPKKPLSKRKCSSVEQHRSYVESYHILKKWALDSEQSCKQNVIIHSYHAILKTETVNICHKLWNV